MLDQHEQTDETARTDDVGPNYHGWRKLNAFFWANWFALGNVLLLMGGDDSVDVAIPFLTFLDSN